MTAIGQCALTGRGLELVHNQIFPGPLLSLARLLRLAPKPDFQTLAGYCYLALATYDHFLEVVRAERAARADPLLPPAIGLFEVFERQAQHLLVVIETQGNLKEHQAAEILEARAGLRWVRAQLSDRCHIIPSVAALFADRLDLVMAGFNELPALDTYKFSDPQLYGNLKTWLPQSLD